MLNYLLRLRRKKGFTLIELIVVLVILAILVAAALPAMMGYVERARAAQHYAEMRAAIVSSKVALEIVNALDDEKNVEFLIYDKNIPDVTNASFAKHIEENLDEELCKRVRVFIHFGDKTNGVQNIEIIQIRLYFSDDRAGEFLYYEEGPSSTNPNVIQHYKKEGVPAA